MLYFAVPNIPAALGYVYNIHWVVTPLKGASRFYGKECLSLLFDSGIIVSHFIRRMQNRMFLPSATALVVRHPASTTNEKHQDKKIHTVL